MYFLYVHYKYNACQNGFLELEWSARVIKLKKGLYFVIQTTLAF